MFGFWMQRTHLFVYLTFCMFRYDHLQGILVVGAMNSSKIPSLASHVTSLQEEVQLKKNATLIWTLSAWLSFLYSLFWSNKTKDLGKEGKYKYGEGKWTFNLKPSDKLLAPRSSVSIILDEILFVATSAKQLLLRSTILPFMDLSISWLTLSVLPGASKSGKTARHCCSIC